MQPSQYFVKKHCNSLILYHSSEDDFKPVHICFWSQLNSISKNTFSVCDRKCKCLYPARLCVLVSVNIPVQAITHTLLLWEIMAASRHSLPCTLQCIFLLLWELKNGIPVVAQSIFRYSLCLAP